MVQVSANTKARKEKESRQQGWGGSGTPEVTLGLDVSDIYTHLCAVDEAAQVIGEQRVRTKPEALTKALTAYPGARVVLEAGPHSPWLSRLVAELGYEVIVANPREVALIARSHRKDDRFDAEQLARLGRLDPEAARAHRAPERAGAGGSAGAAQPRGAGAPADGARQPCPWFGQGIRCLVAGGPDDAHLPPDGSGAHPEELRPALLGVIESIATLNATIASYDQEIERLCTERYPETAVLRRVPGVGPITSLAYVLTIEHPGRFARSRDVGPYLGLAPRRRDSGSRQSQLGISKRGDTHLRRLLVQAAHYILGPFGPDTDLRRWGERYQSSGAANAKKRALVAVARRLAVLLHALFYEGRLIRKADVAAFCAVLPIAPPRPQPCGGCRCRCEWRRRLVPGTLW